MRRSRFFPRRRPVVSNFLTAVEKLESRTLLSASHPIAHAAKANAPLTKDVVSVGTGNAFIYGTVYEDLNNNNIQDINEPVAAGITVYIDINNNGVLDAGDPVTITDSVGGFGFTNIIADGYVLRIVPTPGFFLSPPGYVTVIANPNEIAIAEIAETNTTVGLMTTISGTVFDDVNGDGIYTPNTELFLAGDTVYIDTNGNGQFDPGEPYTQTNNIGFYSFNVTVGTYELRVIPRAGFHQDPPGFYEITVTAGTRISPTSAKITPPPSLALSSRT